MEATMATATVTLDGNTKIQVVPSLGQKILAAQLAGQEKVDCTEEELKYLLGSLNRHNYSQFVGITTDTEPRLKGGKSNPLVGLRKVSTYRGRFHGWKDAVENQQERDGAERDYTPVQPRGKEYVGDSPLMVGSTQNTREKFYLAIIPVRSGKPSVSYYHPTVDVSQEDAKEAVYVAPNRGSKQQRAGVQNEVTMRTPLLVNITYLHLGGFKFRVV
jgi:hypothetical protein